MTEYCTIHTRLVIREQDDTHASKVYYEIYCHECDFKVTGYRGKDDLNLALYELIEQGHAKSGLDRKHLTD